MFIFFVIELMYVSWSSVHVQCLDLQLLRTDALFWPGMLLLVYLVFMAVKDGLFFMLLHKDVLCIGKKSLLIAHGLVLQPIDVLVLAVFKYFVCFNNTETQDSQLHVIGQTEFYEISRWNVIVAMTFAVCKIIAIIHLSFHFIFGKKLI